MAHINRRYIDKHWMVFLVRGVIAGIAGLILLCGNFNNTIAFVPVISIFLLSVGIIDAVGALYSSTKKHGWINSIIDAVIDVVASIYLLLFANGDLVSTLIILSIYTVASGLIDIFHGFLSTVDPTDRFIRVLAGVCGCVIGAVIINAGDLEITTFVRFFGVYLMIVGATSLIYGTHNRAQESEDLTARRESRKKRGRSLKARK